MDEVAKKFLKDLLLTASPSGFETSIQEVVKGWAKSCADEIKLDTHGNLIAILHPTKKVKNPLKVMLAGHCDQIGLMVQYIDNDGFIYVQPIGGWDIHLLLGQYLTIWGKKGPVAGVLSRKAIHLLQNDEKNKTPQFTDLWVDIGATKKEEAEELVSCGDPITVSLRYQELQNRFAAAVAMDDKVGVWVVMMALKMLKESPRKVEIYCVSTVQEEIGLRGAITSSYSINPQIGIAVDVCHATDTPSNDKKLLGEIKLGSGPVLFRGANINKHVHSGLVEAAKKWDCPVQIRGVPKATGTDANVIQIAREGVATGLIGIPNRYMHSPVETIHLDDLYYAAKILAGFCSSISPENDWIP